MAAAIHPCSRLAWVLEDKKIKVVNMVKCQATVLRQRQEKSLPAAPTPVQPTIISTAEDEFQPGLFSHRKGPFLSYLEQQSNEDKRLKCDV